MNPETESRLGKAHRSLEAAQLLLDTGRPDFAASRGYYAAFYAADAFLRESGFRLSGHTALITAFGRRVKKGEVPAHLHRVFRDAFDYRRAADYGHFELDTDAVVRLLQGVTELVEMLEQRVRRRH